MLPKRSSSAWLCERFSPALVDQHRNSHRLPSVLHDRWDHGTTGRVSLVTVARHCRSRSRGCVLAKAGKHKCVIQKASLCILVQSQSRFGPPSQVRKVLRRSGVSVGSTASTLSSFFCVSAVIEVMLLSSSSSRRRRPRRRVVVVVIFIIITSTWCGHDSRFRHHHLHLHRLWS